MISIDGTPVQGNLLPDFRDGKVHQVEGVLKRNSPIEEDQVRRWKTVIKKDIQYV